jgi:TetR/AcrR family transcriptional regulator
VLVGDALVHENPRLQARINQLLDRIESTLKQCLKVASAQGALAADHDFGAHADLLVCYTLGRWQRFVKSAFKDDPLAELAGAVADTGALTPSRRRRLLIKPSARLAASSAK